VWELDGPTPIEKRSKTLTVIGIRYRIAIGWNLRTGPMSIVEPGIYTTPGRRACVKA